MKNTLLFLLFFHLTILQCTAQENPLQTEITNYLSDKDALVGVAIYDFESGETILINEKEHYPMQSVYKFHLALSILNQVDEKRFSLEDDVLMTSDDLRPHTWSPIREKYPEGNVTLSLAEVIEYTVGLSDNNGCDKLFELVGGPEVSHQFIQNLGIEEISIQTTEHEMHQDWETQFTNWTTPVGMLALLKKFYHQEILSEESHHFLWETMLGTQTGKNKLKAQLPANTKVAHKTGMSAKNDEGLIAADNDAGIIELPNGNHVAVVVFVSDSKEGYENNAEIIASIGKMTWDYFLEN